MRSILSQKAAKVSALLQAAGAIGIVALCVFLCATRAGYLVADLKTNVTVSAALMLAALAGAAGLSRVLRLSTADAACFMIVFPARNIGVLAAVVVATLHHLDDLVFILIYFVLETLLMLAVALAYRWRSSSQTVST